MLLTLLRVSTTIISDGIVSTDSITTPQTTPPLTEELFGEFKSVLEKLDWQLALEPWSECHLSTKAGPNGPALLSSIVDLHLLPDWLIKSISVLGGESLQQRMAILKSNIPLDLWMQFFKMKPSSFIRKLSVIHDSEAKERVIAILDYWSQAALVPLHKGLFDLLRSIKGDCTHKQDNFIHWLPSQGPYFSMDLTSATDRFPVSLQKFVLEQLIGPEKAEAWEQILVKEPYTFMGRTIAYAVGQPMGAYSS
jgi:hypothetical protein